MVDWQSPTVSANNIPSDRAEKMIVCLEIKYDNFTLHILIPILFLLLTQGGQLTLKIMARHDSFSIYTNKTYTEMTL